MVASISYSSVSNRPNKVIREARSVVGMELDSQRGVREVLDDTSHPLHDVLASDRSTLSERQRNHPCLWSVTVLTVSERCDHIISSNVF